MAAIETALAVTLLPHFIADTSSVSQYQLPNNQPYVITHHRRSFLRTPPVSGGTNRGGTDVDKLETLDYGGCPTDLKGA